MMEEKDTAQSMADSYDRMTRNLNTTRIWDMAERLAEAYYYTLPRTKKSKEELLEIFKYYLRELMKSEV